MYAWSTSKFTRLHSPINNTTSNPALCIPINVTLPQAFIKLSTIAHFCFLSVVNGDTQVRSVTGMLGTWTIDLEPAVNASLMVDAETGQSGDGVALFEFAQTNYTFVLLVLCQHILCSHTHTYIRQHQHKLVLVHNITYIGASYWLLTSI